MAPRTDRAVADPLAQPPGAACRILIVDDSVVARAVMGRVVEGSGRYVVAAAVADAAAAVSFLRDDQVDGILLDIEMPGIDGITALPDLLAAANGAKVLIVSSSAAEGAASTVQALALGAADTLVKPGVSAFAGKFADVLLEKLDRLVSPRISASPSPAMALPLGEESDVAPTVSPTARLGAGSFDIIAIGASTGGIHALSQLLRQIPARVTTPILITQHLPASFMPYFAAQISVLAGRPCDVATECLRITPGRVMIAPGNGHLRCVALGDGGAAVRLSREPVASGCMPSVDPMFDSLAEIYGERLLAIVLSGMGRDGSVGARKVAAHGGRIVVQDADSSVVWGMPGSVAAAGLADAILPPDEIGRLVASRQVAGSPAVARSC